MLSNSPKFVVVLLANSVAATSLSQACQPVLGTPIDLATYYSYGTECVGDLLYIAASVRGPGGGKLIVLDSSTPNSPKMFAEILLDQGATNIAVSESLAYVTSNSKLYIVDVSAPTAPQLLGQLDGFLQPRDIEIHDNTALVANWTGDLSLVDVSNPAVPELIASVPTIENPHSIAITGNTAYVTCRNLGLCAVDFSDTSNPIVTAVPGFTSDNYHDVAIHNSTLILLDSVSSVFGTRTLQVLDTTKHPHLTELGRVILSTPVESVRLYGNTAVVSGYTSIGNIEPTEAGLMLIDVSNPSNPVQTGEVLFDSLGPSLAINNGFAYVATQRELVQIVDFSFCFPQNCSADTNGDGALTASDFTAWLHAFEDESPICDQNGDGSCTPTDFTAWIANYNAGC